jgi:hypothetical protein
MERYEFPLLEEDMSLFLVKSDFVSKESFFHSILIAFKEYRGLQTEKERERYIQGMREKVSKSFTEMDWLHIHNGHFAFVQIFEMMRITIHLLPHVEKEDEKKQWEEELLELIYLLVNPSLFEKEVFPRWNFDTISIEHNSLETWKDIFMNRLTESWKELCNEMIMKRIHELEKHIPDEKIMDVSTKEKVIHRLVFTCCQLLQYGITESFQEFCKTISSQEEPSIEFMDFYLSMITKLNIPNICVLILEPSIPSVLCSRPNTKELSKYFFILIHLSSQDTYSFHSISQKKKTNDHKILMNRIFRYEDPVIQSLLPHISYHYR